MRQQNPRSDSNRCFVAGTLVLTDDGQVPIEDIEAGDYVYATDPETGESGYKQVVQTFENETTELVTVTYEDDQIIATPTHPFYVPQKGWTEAINLRAGDILVTSNGEYVVVEKIQHEILETPVTVYNFEVEDYHTYYVGNDDSVLVHNDCTKIGSGHGNTTHKARIDSYMDELATSGNYTTVYGNRSLSTVGLKGTQRPDIIAKARDGVYHVWEFASQSQASGRGAAALARKISIMSSNNPSVVFHPIIPW